MAPKLRRRLPKEPGWEHLQPYQVARREQCHEAGHRGRVRTHLHLRPSKRTGTLSSPWTTTHYRSISQSMVPSTSMNSARKRPVQVRRFLLICYGKVCIPSSSRRLRDLLEVVVRAPSPSREAALRLRPCLRFRRTHHTQRYCACFGSYIG
jgi:hypothetical protein